MLLFSWISKIFVDFSNKIDPLSLSLLPSFFSLSLASIFLPSFFSLSHFFFSLFFLLFSLSFPFSLSPFYPFLPLSPFPFLLPISFFSHSLYLSSFLPFLSQSLKVCVVKVEMCMCEREREKLFLSAHGRFFKFLLLIYFLLIYLLLILFL